MLRLFHIIRGGFRLWRALAQARRDVEEGQGGNGEYGVVTTLTALGPTFIKLGQMLALRIDLIPAPLTRELRQLLDHGEPVSTKAVHRQFQREFKKRPADCFEEFEEHPFAVASLAQVHRARYRGEDIAVKVQKPGIRDAIHGDLRLARFTLWWFHLVPGAGRWRRLLEDIVNEFFLWIEHELDYRLEALNMTRMKQHADTAEEWHVPAVVHEYSSRRVLSMELVEGVSLNEILACANRSGNETTIHCHGFSIDRKSLVDNAIAVAFQQVFEYGYFHADPHPANAIVQRDGTLTFIDFGVVGVLVPRLREAIMQMFIGLANRDVKGIAETLVAIDEVEGHDEMAQIERRIQGVLDRWQSGSVLEMSMAESFYHMVEVSVQSGIELPLSFAIVGKTLLEYDGGIRILDPERDLVQALRPHVERWYSKHGGFSTLIPTSAQDLFSHLKELPSEAHRLVSALLNDGLEVTVRIGPKSK